MKVLQILPVLLSLIYTTVSFTIWPTHIICKNKNLEVSYRSCDPLQDVDFSVDSCTYATEKIFTMQLATVLKYIYYTGPFFLTLDNIPLGEFDVRAQFFNEDHHTAIICADFYTNNQ